MKAIVSDIHGNLEAMLAVLQDIERQSAQEICCLGDLVGYGPNPAECIDLARQWKVVLQGNFDRSVLEEEPNVGLAMLCANRSLAWSRRELAQGDPDAVHKRWSLLHLAPHSYREGEFLFAHATADSCNEFVLPEDFHNDRKMHRVFSGFERYCFAGHSHIPGVFTEDGQFNSPPEIGYVHRLDGKTLVNVGSVGQPHDGDWRARYALLDDTTVRFRRVQYDVEATIRKIYDNPELDNFLGDRLREGR